MIKAVLFDLDNTLIDFMGMKHRSVDAAINAMIEAGVKVEKEKAESILYAIYRKHGIEHQHVFQKFLRAVQGRISYKALAEGIVAYRNAQAQVLQPYKEVVPTLRSLKKRGLKLAIVSDAPRLKAWIRLVELGIQNFFDVIVCYADTGHYKHTGLPFRKALKMLNLMPEETIMVGDWPERDIVGAKKLGIKTIFAKYGTTKDVTKSGADFEINSMKEVMVILKQFNSLDTESQ